MKATVIHIICFFFINLIFSQGLVFEDEQYAQIPQLSTIDGLKNVDLPSSIDLSSYCPNVRNQGDVYSCVGWAVGYGALTIKKAIKYQMQSKKEITEQAYSAMFIYNQIKRGDCSQGSRISDALHFLKTQGDCLASEFDTDIEDCEMLPNAALLNQIKTDTISDYLTLFNIKEQQKQKVDKTIRALARQEPVIVGMSVRKNFYQLQGAKYWWPDLGNNTPAGGHAMVVVGYDLASASFLLFNSWGTEWGKSGFIRIKFKDFSRFCKYAFIVVLDSRRSTTKATTTTAATVQLKHLEGFSKQGESIFKNTPLQFHGKGVYTSQQNNWPVGQLFQLVTNAEQSGLYLYAFSIDAEQKASIHWPRIETKKGKHKGLNESPLLIDSNVKVTIPGKEKALRLSNEGKDVMYLLYSEKPIQHLDFIIAKMQDCQEAYYERLADILGKHLVPPLDITYAPNTASFKVSTWSKGYIVPIIVTLDVI